MKILLFTDIHFGLKNNSSIHNNNCLDFIDFVIEEAIKNNIDEVMFLGDWTHDRNKINLLTLKYAFRGFEKLNNLNKPIRIILGNHDMFYKHNRDVHSMPYLTTLTNIQLIEQPIIDTTNKFLFVPFLTETESMEFYIQNHPAEYVFCHAEFPSFKLNKNVVLDGEYNPIVYQGPKRICSGHFHLRQEKNNITYIGNCFSHDYSDNLEWENKGIAILDTTNNEMTYKTWQKAPKYLMKRISSLSQADLMVQNLNLKLINDVQMTPLQLSDFKHQIQLLDNVSDCLIYPLELEITHDDSENDEHMIIEDLSTLIITLLKTIQMDNISNDMLIQEFKDL